MRAYDIIVIRTCPEIEHYFYDDMSAQYNKHVLRIGPEQSCSVPLGANLYLEKDQLQELILGFEMITLPFLMVVKPHKGCTPLKRHC
ncbi:UDP-glycosyltransferase 79B8 [Bienertia sinuspersici]